MNETRCITCLPKLISLLAVTDYLHLMEANTNEEG